MVTKGYIEEMNLKAGERIEADFRDWLYPEDKKVYTMSGYFNRKKTLSSESSQLVLDNLVTRVLKGEKNKERLELFKDLNDREYRKKIPFLYVDEIRKLRLR